MPIPSSPPEATSKMLIQISIRAQEIKTQRERERYTVYIYIYNILSCQIGASEGNGITISESC